MDSPAWKEPWPWRDPKGGLKRDNGGEAGRQEGRKMGQALGDIGRGTGFIPSVGGSYMQELRGKDPTFPASSIDVVVTLKLATRMQVEVYSFERREWSHACFSMGSRLNGWSPSSILDLEATLKMEARMVMP